MASIPAGAVIDDAKLGLYMSAAAANPSSAELHPVTPTWDEAQVTWNDRLTGTPWTTAGGDYDARVTDVQSLNAVLGWKTWNVTQIVDLWYRSRVPNNGMIILGSAGGTNLDKTFWSSDYAVDPTLRPKLDIRYRVLGATGEYISKIGGPGSLVAWQSISWNPSERSYVSDEFNGGSLDPKWTWTNPPATYDEGTTTPGSLHIVSSTGVDLDGATFTGNVLANEVVGDFTAIAKISGNPTVAGQKAGLMVLLNNRNWYAVQKVNVAGTVNWQAKATT
ncbi:MAG: DNRLRE domain-containing protein, partial [Methanobacteriota archaeon]